jgi:outer membrane protein
MLKRAWLSVLLFCVAVPVVAQQTRVAYINSSKLLKRMPEATDARQRLDQLVQTWSKEANDMQSEITRKQADYDRRKLIMTDAERNAAELDLQNLHKRLDDYRHQKFDENGGELFAQQSQLMKNAYDKLSGAIKEVALDGNFDYVIDVSSRDVTLLYANAKFDLTIPVARKLGIESEVLTTPLLGGNQSKPGAPNAPAAPPNNDPMNPGGMNKNVSPNNGTTLQSQPGFNSGGYNPQQVPPPPAKEPVAPSK